MRFVIQRSCSICEWERILLFPFLGFFSFASQSLARSLSLRLSLLCLYLFLPRFLLPALLLLLLPLLLLLLLPILLLLLLLFSLLSSFSFS